MKLSLEGRTDTWVDLVREVLIEGGRSFGMLVFCDFIGVFCAGWGVSCRRLDRLDWFAGSPGSQKRDMGPPAKER
jgi:hypothetical protein